MAYQLLINFLQIRPVTPSYRRTSGALGLFGEGLNIRSGSYVRDVPWYWENRGSDFLKVQSAFHPSRLFYMEKGEFDHGFE
jgi:hypothetical protein